MRLIAAILLTLGAAPAGADTFSDVYDVYFGGVYAGDLALTVETDGDAYTARSHLRTAGLIGALYKVRYTATAEGREQGMRPDVFQASSRFGGDKQALVIEFGPSAPAKVTGDPAFKPKPYQIDPRAQTGAIDPLSAAVAAFTPAPPDQTCGRTIKLFEGRRRADLEIAPATAHEAGVVCKGVFRRIAGYRPKDMAKETEFPFSLEFDLVDDKTRLRRIEVPTSYGVGVLLRQEKG